MTATALRPAPANISAGVSALRYDRLLDVVVGIPGAEIVEHLDAHGVHPKVRFTVPAPVSYPALEVTLGERLLVVGTSRLNGANFVGVSVSTCRMTVMGQIVRHMLTDAVRSHFSGLRTASGVRAVDGQLWASSLRPTSTGGEVGVTLVDPVTGRHLHLEIERTGLALRPDSRSIPVPATAEATRAHLERVAEAYGRTYEQFLSELRVFAGEVRDHPVMAIAAAVAARV